MANLKLLPEVIESDFLGRNLVPCLICKNYQN